MKKWSSYFFMLCVAAFTTWLCYGLSLNPKIEAALLLMIGLFGGMVVCLLGKRALNDAYGRLHDFYELMVLLCFGSIFVCAAWLVFNAPSDVRLRGLFFPILQFFGGNVAVAVVFLIPGLLLLSALIFVIYQITAKGRR